MQVKVKGKTINGDTVTLYPVILEHVPIPKDGYMPLEPKAAEQWLTLYIKACAAGLIGKPNNLSDVSRGQAALTLAKKGWIIYYATVSNPEGIITDYYFATENKQAPQYPLTRRYTSAPGKS